MTSSKTHLSVGHLNTLYLGMKQVKKIVKLVISTTLFIIMVSCNSEKPTPAPPPNTQTTLLEKLNQLVDVQASKHNSSISGYSYYSLIFNQLTDHNDDSSAKFPQHVRLYIRDSKAPVVLKTLGYGMSAQASTDLDEISSKYLANVVEIEHRYFALSAPENIDWSTMTIQQAATDHHKIITALKPLLTGKWLATGKSKGGMTATFLKRFYPEDVEGVVAYVAPLSLAMWDERYAEYSLSVVEPQCLEKFKTYQRQALLRADELLPMIEEWALNNNQIVSGFGYQLRDRLEALIALSWITIGSYYPDMLCEYLPLVEDETQYYFDFIYLESGFMFLTNEGFESWLPYHVQSAMQLGNFAVPLQHIEDLLSFDVKDFQINMLDTPMPLLQTEVMQDIYSWAEHEASHVIMIYGEQDIFTGGAYPIPTDENRDTQIHIEPGLHGITIEDLSNDAQDKIHSALQRWLQ